MNSSDIKVRVFDMEDGLLEYENIKCVRIVSKDYNLLIMKDYMPIIGEINGNVDIIDLLKIQKHILNVSKIEQ